MKLEKPAKTSDKKQKKEETAKTLKKRKERLEMFILKVKQINGEINSLDLENGEDSLVFDVKSRLSQLIEVEVERIRLIYIGRVMFSNLNREYRVAFAFVTLP